MNWEQIQAIYRERKRLGLPAGEEQVVPHTCPYLEDIGNDTKTLCTCTPAMEGECHQDI